MRRGLESFAQIKIRAFLRKRGKGNANAQEVAATAQISLQPVANSPSIAALNLPSGRSARKLPLPMGEASG